jgi:hypothetical protein
MGQVELYFETSETTRIRASRVDAQQKVTPSCATLLRRRSQFRQFSMLVERLESTLDAAAGLSKSAS